MVASPPVFRATFFDYNGVLVDDEHVHLAAFSEVLAPLGIQLDESTYWERYLGFDDVGAFEAILNDHGQEVSREIVLGLVERKRPVYLRRAEGTLKPFRGAAELVERRARMGPAIIVSGALRDEIRMGLRVLGVEALVEEVISAEETTRSKPDPEGYDRAIAALRRHGLAAADAVVIEDSTAGVEAAKAAHLACVAVTHSYEREELARAGADLVVGALDSIDETALAALFRRIRG